MNSVSKRNYYFDILRIIAMLMIIMHHITINDFGLLPHINGTENHLSNTQLLILMIINSFVIVGVNLFFLISGYFRIRFSFKKIISLIVQVYIVYGIVTGIGIISNHVVLEENTIKNILFPFDLYWFLAAYVALMLLSPFLNNLIDYIKKDNKKIIILILLLFSLYAFRHDSGLFLNGGYSLLWAITMYIVGGLINKFKIQNKHGIYLYIICAFLLAALVYGLFQAGKPQEAWGLYRYNNVIVLIESLGLFIWVNSWKFKISSEKVIRIISFLATNTLMVYLLHSTCWLTIIRRMPIVKIYQSGLFKLGILLLPIYALLIYIVCSLISLLYKVSFQRIINKLMSDKKV